MYLCMSVCLRVCVCVHACARICAYIYSLIYCLLWCTGLNVRVTVGPVSDLNATMYLLCRLLYYVTCPKRPEAFQPFLSGERAFTSFIQTNRNKTSVVLTELTFPKDRRKNTHVIQ